MELRRLDDYQSWALEQGGRRLLIDPWLTEEMSLDLGHWMFGRRRAAPAPVTRWLPVDALVLTTHFSDHLHPGTLAALPRELPVFASTGAARLLRRLGFTQVTALRDGARASPWPGLELEAVSPAFPFSLNALGYVFDGDGRRLYLEPHLVHVARAKARVGHADLVLAPVQSVRLVGMPFAMSAETAVEVARALTPARWVPTGVDPALAHGLLSRAFLFCRGSLDDFHRDLAAAQVGTQLASLAQGEAVAV